MKRHRSSVTPPHSERQEASAGHGMSDGPSKRRRLDGESKHKHKGDALASSSPDTRPAKSGLSRERHLDKLDAKDDLPNTTSKDAGTTNSTSRDPNAEADKSLFEKRLRRSSASSLETTSTRKRGQAKARG